MLTLTLTKIQRPLWPMPFAHDVRHTALLVQDSAKPRFAKMRLLLVKNFLGHFRSLEFQVLKSHIKCMQDQIKPKQIQSFLFPPGTGGEGARKKPRRNEPRNYYHLAKHQWKLDFTKRQTNIK